jgi:hypothetical protein
MHRLETDPFFTHINHPQHSPTSTENTNKEIHKVKSELDSWLNTNNIFDGDLANDILGTYHERKHTLHQNLRRSTPDDTIFLPNQPIMKHNHVPINEVDSYKPYVDAVMHSSI